MSAIHITTGSGQSKIYEEDQARALWMEGHFGEGTLFWREGMAEWQPIAILFPPTAVYQPTPAYRPGMPPLPLDPNQGANSVFGAPNQGPYRFAKDPTTLTKVLKVLLWLELAVVVVSLLSDFAQMSMIKSGGFTDAEAEANDQRQAMIGVAYLVVFIITGITFLKWIYRANVNCRGFGAQNMEFTPGWSVGWYFIPFLNLVRPFQAMKEIWKVSTDPQRWQMQQSAGILTLWWTLWILSNITGQITFRTSMAVNDLPSLEVATSASIASNLVDVPLTLVAITLVSRIYKKQHALTQRV
ncbi:uncharacterized protein DUF4339 [Prosthecobacter fusiformis]|uniref:Uncharacterized protein DUF4339 n=1 Tax=Prosthecobacter fusiformis TaxID=48464 RepID=A0A4R7RIG2_9BACT|nr:DUF4328 domain-containing protein [Prosthecobacter fusiformis]TDU63088.1 uncharacterized protein DUF4339 [Prosthecobacter fusiformis]